MNPQNRGWSIWASMVAVCVIVVCTGCGDATGSVAKAAGSGASTSAVHPDVEPSAPSTTASAREAAFGETFRSVAFGLDESSPMQPARIASEADMVVRGRIVGIERGPDRHSDISAEIDGAVKTLGIVSVTAEVAVAVEESNIAKRGSVISFETSVWNGVAEMANTMGLEQLSTLKSALPAEGVGIVVAVNQLSTGPDLSGRLVAREALIFDGLDGSDLANRRFIEFTAKG